MRTAFVGNAVSWFVSLMDSLELVSFRATLHTNQIIGATVTIHLVVLLDILLGGSYLS